MMFLSIGNNCVYLCMYTKMKEIQPFPPAHKSDVDTEENGARITLKLSKGSWKLISALFLCLVYSML